MKKRSIFTANLLILSLVLTTVASLFSTDTASAKKITSISQAKQLAKKKVKGATIIEAEKDHDDGIWVYEIELIKGQKEYNLKYRASNSKLIAYSWEIQSEYIKKGSGSIISRLQCKKLAWKTVPNGKITSIQKKRSDGIDYYKVKMRKGGKRYELEIHARTGKLLEYEWE